MNRKHKGKFPKMTPFECRQCHVVMAGPRFWHLWWCGFGKFVRVNF